MTTKKLLSLLWIFLTVNYIFCDVFTLMHSEDLLQIMNGKVGDTELSQNFLLIFSMVMEIPMVMILVSYLANKKISRPLNLIAAVLLLIVQVGSLFVDDNSLHYYFFSIVEIAACCSIIYLAFTWKNETKTG